MPDEELDPTTPEAPPAAPSAEDLQAQIADLKEQAAEAQRTAEFWAAKAQQSTTPRPPAPAPAAGEEEDPDVLDAITMRGAKGFDDLVSKRGFIRKSEVEAMLDAKTTAIGREEALKKEYPDLENRNSEFFKATSVYYGDLIKQGTPQLVAMELAARQAELAFLREGKTKAVAAKDDKDALRKARIAAQSPGSSGGRRPAASATDDEESTELTPEQKHIADAMGVSHEAYAKRAKAGVAMGGGRR